MTGSRSLLWSSIRYHARDPRNRHPLIPAPSAIRDICVSPPAITYHTNPYHTKPYDRPVRKLSPRQNATIRTHAVTAIRQRVRGMSLMSCLTRVEIRFSGTTMKSRCSIRTPAIPLWPKNMPLPVLAGDGQSDRRIRGIGARRSVFVFHVLVGHPSFGADVSGE